MTDDVYARLREQLDQYSIRFPSTESGVELEILRRLFDEEEAELYLEMSMMLEPPEAVARRTGREPAATAALLERMAGEGLLFRQRRGEAVRYGALPFVIGIYEHQLETMDRGLAELFERYLDEAFLERALADNVAPLRTIPVGRSIDVTRSVAPYADARRIVSGKDRIAVADCLCRVQQELIGKGCDRPKEVCFSFGSHAEYYVENGMGRFVTRQEALEILDRCEAAGLVAQPANMVDPGGLCNCCGDCCGVLRALRRHPRPADLVFNDYFAEVDPELCTGCATCLDRCQVEAVRLEGELAAVDRARCIGCGLCVTTCPAEAMRLVEKPEAERRAPPPSGQALMLQTAEARGTTVIPLAVQRRR